MVEHWQSHAAQPPTWPFLYQVSLSQPPQGGKLVFWDDRTRAVQAAADKEQWLNDVTAVANPEDKG